ncbi:MAG: 30S ribosomal protein S12 methylthiotransferase RimO [Defluviitaleaceae bacterium]|nr:30S ribosomal protein S12 methylthiotransferase RimO [Defluviitaleaceae bacterium]
MDTTSKLNGIKATLVSLGCDKNTVDSEIMLGMLAASGVTMTADLESAQVIIINTCGFLQDAVGEAKEEVELALEHKKSGSCKVLIVTGCAAKRYPDEFLNTDGIDIVLGVAEYGDLIPRVLEYLEGDHSLPIQGDVDMAQMHLIRIPSTPKHYAYLRIAEGCDSHCAYCTIPKIRGAYTSREMQSLLDEARRLVDFGVKEIIIVAQDTTLYGKDIYGEQRLHTLLQELSQIEGVKWLRLLYCYPEHIYDELLEEMAQNPKILPYIDLPIQHSVDRILKLMNRKSTTQMLNNTIEKIRKAMPNAVLRTTLITGFPGENEEDFDEVCKFIETVKFDRLGVFPYSREGGTPANKLPNHLPEKTKKERHDQLMQIQQKISKKKLAQRLGEVVEVVVEGLDEGIYFGRSYGEAPDVDGVIFIENEEGLQIGDFVRVKIVETWEYDMIGEITNEPAK